MIDKETKCDGECHFQQPYGFVPHAGCPLHDKMTEEERKSYFAPPETSSWEDLFQKFVNKQDLTPREIHLFGELVSNVATSEYKRGQQQERQFILNILDGIDIADKEMGNKGGGTKAIRHALQSRII